MFPIFPRTIDINSDFFEINQVKFALAIIFAHRKVGYPRKKFILEHLFWKKFFLTFFLLFYLVLHQIDYPLLLDYHCYLDCYVLPSLYVTFSRKWPMNIINKQLTSWRHIFFFLISEILISVALISSIYPLAIFHPSTLLSNFLEQNW